MKNLFTKPVSGFQETAMFQTLKMKASANRFFIYALELTLLFVLVFATVSTFAQSQASATSDSGKLEFVKQTLTYNSGKVYLNWIAKSNASDCIYVIERTNEDGDYEPVGLKEGIGSPVELLYSWVDSKPTGGTTEYRIKQVDNDGNLVAQSNSMEINIARNPLYLDKSSRMVMVK